MNTKQKNRLEHFKFKYFMRRIEKFMPDKSITEKMNNALSNNEAKEKGLIPVFMDESHDWSNGSLIGLIHSVVKDVLRDVR
jgi:hypothetical protein